MALQNPPARNVPSDDELDDILNGLTDTQNVATTHNNSVPTGRLSNRDADPTGSGLGIDEEITITKKRIPIPKLNEERLASDAGIPRLRRISKDRLRFKGKGHEYGDIARMLNMYQLWLDDLYPRAKFADALAIIEKVGHTKRMHLMRKEWINEGKPRRTTEQDEDGDINDNSTSNTPEQHHLDRTEGVESNKNIEESLSAPAWQQQAHDRQEDATADEDPDEDELDALLAESVEPGTSVSKTLPSRTVVPENDPFADEMEAMADMEDMW